MTLPDHRCRGLDRVTRTGWATGRGAICCRGYFARARDLLDRYKGREVKTTGEGLIATFEGPANAILFAARNIDAARELGLEIRAGVHVGEVELVGDDIRGVAVHEAERVCAAARAGEVLVSETTRALALASGLDFEDRGSHELKGIAGRTSAVRVRPHVVKPVILAVDDDPASIGHISVELQRRYDRDYRIVFLTSSIKALAQLGAMAERGERVALVLADQWMPDITGADLLSRVT